MGLGFTSSNEIICDLREYEIDHSTVQLSNVMELPYKAGNDTKMFIL